jgi:hypothetical protein
LPREFSEAGPGDVVERGRVARLARPLAVMHDQHRAAGRFAQLGQRVQKRTDGKQVAALVAPHRQISRIDHHADRLFLLDEFFQRHDIAGAIEPRQVGRE